jgi:DNA segregation ATPase FtsK/SpoIIIE, S-DNA-T family
LVVPRIRNGGRHQQSAFIYDGSGVGVNPHDLVAPSAITSSNPYPPSEIDFDHLKHVIIGGAAWALAIVCVAAFAIVAWRLRSSATYEQCFGAAAGRVRWRLWAVFGWPRVAKACGLSASERVYRENSEGKTTTKTVWIHPRLLHVGTSGHCLRITVRARIGQTVDDLENAAPAIRDAVGAHSARSVVVAPGTVRMEFVMRQHLATPNNAQTPRQLMTTAVRLGRCENGSTWTLRIAGRHTLAVGCTGSGKGSIFWGIAGGFGPAVQAGSVRLVAIDLKYGVEVSIGASLFTKVVTTDADAVKTLAALEELMDARGRRMAGREREHTPTVSVPLVVLLIDELAGVTAYMSDPALRKQAGASLARILTKGRALGIVVVAFLQDPRKEVLPMRGLFTQTIALRLRSRDEVAMVLGDGLADTAPAHRISPDLPGTGYVLEEDGATLRVRADYWPDTLIRTVATRYTSTIPKRGK